MWSLVCSAPDCLTLCHLRLLVSQRSRHYIASCNIPPSRDVHPATMLHTPYRHLIPALLFPLFVCTCATSHIFLVPLFTFSRFFPISPCTDLNFFMYQCTKSILRILVSVATLQPYRTIPICIASSIKIKQPTQGKATYVGKYDCWWQC